MCEKTRKPACLRSWHNRFVLVLVGSLVGLLVGCKQANEDQFEVADNFLVAYQAKDFDVAGQWVTDSTESQLNGVAEDAPLLAVYWPDSTFRLTDTSNDTLLVVNQYSRINDTTVLIMRQRGGDWQVVFSRNDPVHVARSFLTAFHTGQMQAAAQFVTPDAQRDLEVMTRFYAGWKGPAVTIESLQLNEALNKATVSYREENNTLIKRISLLKYERNWRVAFGKEAQW